MAGDDVSLDVQGNDSAAADTTYLRINTDFTDVAPGTQDATVTIAIPVAGTLTTRQTIHATGTTVAGALDVTGVTTLGATTLTITNVYWGAAADLGITKVTTNGLASVTNVYYWYNGAVTNHEVLP